MYTLLLALVLVGQPAPKLPVYITSAAALEGFSEPSKDRQDSMKDLAKKVKDSKLLTLVTSAEDAAITLVVLGRETTREVNGWSAVNGQGQNKSHLTVILKAGSYETELTGRSGSKGILTGHGAAAGNVVKQLEEWVRANREKFPELAAK